MANLQDAINVIRDMLRNMTGLEIATTYPSENYPSGPFAWCWPNYGNMRAKTFMGVEDNLIEEDHWVEVQIHKHRVDLQVDVESLKTFADQLRDKLAADVDLSGSGYYFQELFYSFGPIGWNERNIFTELDTIGWKFSIHIRSYGS